MPTYLDDLLDGARRRVADARAVEPLGPLRARAEAAPPPPSLRAALEVPDVAVIAEIKRASPSRGPIDLDLDAARRAHAYLAGGASAISVLTEPTGFLGSLADLESVAALGAPTLRKDFVVDPYQVWEARACGAAAVLLIVAALDADQLAGLVDEAGQAGLDALVEVHDEDELDIALAAGARLIGVNARDLRTFSIDRDVFERLRPACPAGTLVVAESGVRDAADVGRYRAAGADAVLVGESLVRAPDPSAAVAALVAAGRVVETKA
jgi:indole-3-glycerol phosphate synthase